MACAARCCVPRCAPRVMLTFVSQAHAWATFSWTSCWLRPGSKYHRPLTRNPLCVAPMRAPECVWIIVRACVRACARARARAGVCVCVCDVCLSAVLIGRLSVRRGKRERARWQPPQPCAHAHVHSDEAARPRGTAQTRCRMQTCSAARHAAHKQTNNSACRCRQRCASSWRTRSPSPSASFSPCRRCSRRSCGTA